MCLVGCFIFTFCVTLHAQVEIDTLKSRLAASNSEKDLLRTVLVTHFKNAMRESDSGEVDSSAMDVGQEGGEGGRGVSSGIETFRFASTGETYVFENAREDVPAGRFISMQDLELARYIDERMLSMVDPSSSEGGPATSFEEATEQSLELARLFSERCKRLAAKPRPHALEVRFCVFVPNSDAHPHSAEQARRPGGHDESPAPAQGQGA